MRTPGGKKAFTSTKLRRSSQAKTQVTRYAYNEYMAHHYAFAMKVAADQEPQKPNLRHRLDGENSLNRTTKSCNKAVKNRTTKLRRTAE